MENSYRFWILCIIVFSLNFLTVKELSTEKLFIVYATKLVQHVYHKGILASEFESKDMMFCRIVLAILD